MNAPFSSLYNYPITGGRIGQIYNATFLTATVPNNTVTTVMSFTGLPAGVYLLSASANVNPIPAKTIFSYYDGTVNSGVGEQGQYYPGGFSLHYFQNTGITRIAAGATVLWRVLVRPSGVTLLNYRCQALRIG